MMEHIYADGHEFTRRVFGEDREICRKMRAGLRPRPARIRCGSYDFVFDACADGQQLKCLTIIDEWTRERLEIDVQGSIRSGRVIELLSRLISVHGAPRYLRSDNGTEFVSRAVLRWLHRAGIDTALIDPGKPWQNGSDESFNGKFRDECLSMEWFRTCAEAKVVIEQCRQHYNADRLHSSLDYLSPSMFKQQSEEQQNKILRKQRKQKPSTNPGATLN